MVDMSIFQDADAGVWLAALNPYTMSDGIYSWTRVSGGQALGTSLFHLLAKGIVLVLLRFGIGLLIIRARDAQ